MTCTVPIMKARYPTADSQDQTAFWVRPLATAGGMTSNWPNTIHHTQDWRRKANAGGGPERMGAAAA